MHDTLAVVGATGAVGRIVLQQLETRDFPYKRLKLLASERSVGQEVTVKGETIKIELLAPGAFKDVDLVIASTPDEVSAEFVPYAVEEGAVVVDESAFWRMDPSVPLIVPEVNPEAIADHKGIIASPNCSTTQMVVALAPLHKACKIKRVVVSTYQATSGAGLAGNVELMTSTQKVLDGETPASKTFQYPIGFNLIPQIGSEKFEGYTSEEMKLVYETRKIMGDDNIQVCPTAVRVPVTIGHSESILVETEQPISVEQARELFGAAPGITVVDDLQGQRYPMPRDCDGKDDVFVGRIRRDISGQGNGIAFWCVSDNLRKGAATNAVQIAELLQQSVATA
ncbi:aspartate-semialdehyde dehydrogenase [Roseiconus lacunae]|uniref:Aspartate-semialdehyde dehydrogenase n=1 Tax=Roseiconus lacunae TaxID=2605694 RepID=A0ABT7PIR5_9BACT|nr:aspartate-semialdehyde dehydrogenase [Roseiconus lacunae]MDM4016383.1 aspartate-semialdehyde dehydrogenase [Roseiconus lacunae]WRQ52014.1 aspartate-semialdehyde dehydrogenase [Stieleria sp. HD01]